MDEFLDAEEHQRHAARRHSALIPIAVVSGMLGLAVLSGGVFAWLRPEPAAPPARLAKDPLLLRGRKLFLERCNSCHGDLGRGDGPLAKSLSGPPPGDLTDETWKHGDEPEQVLRVIEMGVSGTSMAAWKVAFGPPELNALAAYVYDLAGRPVPTRLRLSAGGSGAVEATP